MKNKKLIIIILSCLSLILMITGLRMAATYGDTFKTGDNSLLFILTIGCILLSILLFGTIFGIFLFSLSKSAYPTKPAQLDERQVLVTGKGAEYGLLTVAIAALSLWIWDIFELPQFAEPSAALILAALLGFLVYGVYRIWHGAYFVVNGNPKFITALLIVYAAISLSNGLTDLLDGKLVKDGLLTHHCAVFAAGIMCLFWLATIGLKAIKDRKDEDA